MGQSLITVPGDSEHSSSFDGSESPRQSDAYEVGLIPSLKKVEPWMKFVSIIMKSDIKLLLHRSDLLDHDDLLEVMESLSNLNGRC